LSPQFTTAQRYDRACAFRHSAL